MVDPYQIVKEEVLEVTVGELAYGHHTFQGNFG